MAVPGYPPTKVIPGWCAVVRGTSFRGPVVRRVGTGPPRTAGTATSVFVLSAPRHDLFRSPLPYSTFALCSVLFFLFRA